MTKRKKKVSAWLSEHDSHGIYDCEKAKAAFAKETGECAPWGHGCTHAAMAERIAGRGKGGELAADTGQRFIGAIDMAAACYDRWAGAEVAQPKFGMGSQFREYVGALARAGK